jgi:hypothetical protein
MIAEKVLEEAERAEDDRQIRIAAAWEAYQGKMKGQLKATKSDPQAKDNIIINFAQPIVDKSVSFLMGKNVGFQIGDDTESTEDKWLAAAWEENKKMTLLHKIAMNGGVTGDVFLRLQEADKMKGGKYPRVTNLDPACVLPIWDTDDYENIKAWQVKWKCIDWATAKPMMKRHIYEPEGRRWTITIQESRGNSSKWQTTGTATWPYPWSPILHTQNLPMPNVYNGVSDIETHVQSINGAINFVLSNMARIIRLHAHPKVYVTGQSKTNLDGGPDDVMFLTNPAADIKTIEMTSDLGSSLELYKQLKTLLHQVTRTPEMAGAKMDSIGALSGVALRILFQDLIEKTETKQLLYGDLFVECNRRLMEIGKQGAEQKVSIQWPDALPKDRKAEAETAVVLNTAGVSKETTVTELGYDAQQEKKKRDEEQKADMENAQTAFDRGNVGNGNPYGGQGGGNQDDGK